MSKLFLSTVGIFMLALVFSCKQNKQDASTGNPPVIETRTVRQTKGSDCDQVDSLRTDCAILDCSLPEPKAGSAPQALIHAVDLWADKYLVSLLTYSDYPELNPEKALPSVDAAIKRFHEMHDDAAGAVVAGQFAARTSHETLLNDGKYLTLQINGYCYQGGNHAMESDVEIGSFDVQSGRQFNWDGIVQDKQAFFKLAEQKFREARAEDFDKGFKFGDETKFAMPGAYGLTADGILMHYADNEIYGLYGATDMVVPYSELGTNLRIAPPIPLPQTKDKPALLVTCDSVGNMEFAGKPVKDYDALKAALRPILAEKIKNGEKELPDIETEGCLMGNSGGIRDLYAELKDELTGKTKPAELEKTDEKITTAKPASNSKPASTTKAAPKPAPAKPSTPTVTLKQNGDMLVNGKEVSDLEALRKVLQNALLKEAVIPEKLDLKTVGETGIGMRAEMNTVIAESVTGAKWVRKKNAIAALNTSVGKKLATSTQLELGTYQTSGNFAYLSAKPKQADGKAIDYSKTTYNKDFSAGNFADNAIGLLQFDKGAWKVLAYSIGVSKPPVDAWAKNYKAPKALFGK